jgi:hypothetical protein
MQVYVSWSKLENGQNLTGLPLPASLGSLCTPFVVVIIIIIIIVRMHAFGLVGLHSHSRLSSQLFDSMGNVAAPWPSIEVAHVRGFYLLGALVDW